jgi:3-methyladenine DNA glycosylase AlkD
MTQRAAGIHGQLSALGEASCAAALRRYFKTGPGQYGAGDRFLGVRVPVLRRLARTHSDLALPETAALLRSRWHEERLLALLILGRQYPRAKPRQRAAIYRLYLKTRRMINSWDLVDCSAEHIVGAHLRDGDRAMLRRLAASSRVWDRRIAIMATFHYIKRGEYSETLRLARLLLKDPHDLVHKAVGWMLREVGKRDRAVEEAFLRRYAAQMPRTMLRYAIERFPDRLRRSYLSVSPDR